MMKQMPPPVVTFLLPCVSQEASTALFLQECLQSILAQTFIDLEVLILDDGMDEESVRLADYVSGLDARVSYFRNERPLGLAGNRAQGFQLARGDLIWEMSPKDCLTTAQVVQDMVTQFILQPRLGYAFCRMQMINAHSEPLDAFLPPQKNSELPYHPTLYPGHLLFGQMLRHNLVPDSAAVVRKECFNKRDFAHPKMGESASWYNWLLLALDWDVYFEPSPQVYGRRVHALASVEDTPGTLEERLACYQAVEHAFQCGQYPKWLRRQAQWARLQFMRRKALKMSWFEKVVRLYRQWTLSTFSRMPMAPEPL